ncbi:MAG TPA: type II toxin-antitoxin system HicB family antitoxin [Methanothrix sp.]|nr:type II toxin-antitoxin system HicB family antitoxin [Methanothrix sp.]HPJ84965.1 type II toxin-antitoxin system HicB family antitoxin [Methanothrix sp.]
MRSLSYRVLLRKEPEGCYSAIVPTLPGCVTFGKTIDEAIEAYVESLVARGKEVPTEEGTLEYALTIEAQA